MGTVDTGGSALVGQAVGNYTVAAVRLAKLAKSGQLQKRSQSLERGLPQVSVSAGGGAARLISDACAAGHTGILRGSACSLTLCNSVVYSNRNMPVGTDNFLS